MFRILRVVGKEQRDDAYDELFTKYGNKIEGKTVLHNNCIEQWTK